MKPDDPIAKILSALQQGPKTRRAISIESGLTPNKTRYTLQEMTRMGLASCNVTGGKGAVWRADPFAK